MAIVLYLIEKTPWSVGILTALMILLCIYPILHFFKGKRARIAICGVAVLASATFGWKEWPKPSTQQSPPPPSQANASLAVATQLRPSEQINHLPRAAKGRSSGGVIPRVTKSADDDCPPGTGICMIGANNQGSNFETLDSSRGIIVKGSGSSVDNALAITGTPDDYAVSVGKTEEFIAQMSRYLLHRWKSLPTGEQQKKSADMEDLEKRIRAVEGNPKEVAPLLHQFANM
jgi:hypothetical protein